jgi:LacI family transcriptional regulator
MATMAQVAREAGVSITTVSHVVNGTRPVHPETVARVTAAMARTNFTPNTIARALAGAKTQSIGLAINGISNPYFMDVIAAIEAAGARAGYTLLLVDTHDEAAHELHAARTLVQRRVDGLLLAPSAGAMEGVLPYLAESGTPLVVLDRFVPADVDQVAVENEAPMAALVEHVLGHGHRRVALVAGLDGLTTTVERERGYRRALHAAGLPFDAELVRSGGSRREPAHAAVDALLALPEPPTAIVTANNAMTIGALQALGDRGVRVPDDVALAVFDDFEWATVVRPQLTAVAQPTRLIGERAVELMLRRIADPDAPAERLTLPAELRVRESCGCRQRVPTPPIGMDHRGGTRRAGSP